MYDLIVSFLFGSSGSWGELVLRLSLAFVLWPHGAQKVLGWFGGPGWSGSYRMFTESMGIPGVFAVMAMLTEFLAPLCMAVGLMTRPAAIGLVVLMCVAMSKHVHNGFFMNWFGQKGGEGFEYHVLYAGAALAVVFFGGGAFSVDAWLAGMFL